MAARFHPYGPPAVQAPEFIIRTFLYLCGVYSFTVHLFGRDHHTVTSILWQGVRCTCEASFPNVTTMELRFNYHNDSERLKLSTYTQVAFFHGVRVWANPQHGGQFLLEATTVSGA